MQRISDIQWIMGVLCHNSSVIHIQCVACLDPYGAVLLIPLGEYAVDLLHDAYLVKPLGLEGWVLDLLVLEDHLCLGEGGADAAHSDSSLDGIMA